MDINYRYKALDKNSKIHSGTMKVSNEDSLKIKLKEEGLILVHAEPVGKFNLFKLFKQIADIGTVGTQSKIILYRNLGAMLEAGLSLNRALSVLERQSKNKKLKKVITSVNEKVRKGNSLSNAMLDYKDVFSPLVIAMVQSGEESGNLIQALNVVSDQMEKQHELNKKIKGAMIYPGVIVSAMLAIAVFMLVYIVPTLTATFKEVDVELPASTQFVIGLSDFMKNNFTLFIFLIFIFVSLIYFGFKNKTGRKILDFGILHIPVISTIVKEINAARTTRTLSSLLASGVSFTRSLQITGEVVQNSYYKTVILEAEKNIQIGLPISKVFERNEKLYPVFVSEMMSVGEETGDIGNMLLKVAIFYEREVDQKTKNMSTIIEPILMIVVGVAVGFFAVSMISPMYSLVESI